ncbi:MAG: methylenetetrahydrofolate reductase [Campylobacterales bacterium]
MFDALEEKLKNGRYVTLETTPSHAASFRPVIDTIESLGLHELVDGFSTTDNPLAKLKYNALFAAMMLQQRFGKPVLATMSMRDRNRIALQSDLLGANEADVRAVLALTGDPAKNSDQKNAKGVFESDSTLLLDIIAKFNEGTDLEDKAFSVAPQPILPFAVVNSFARNPKSLQKKMLKKIEHGAQGIITQPVFDLDNAKVLLELMEEANAKNGTNAQLILGLFPITKLRTAQFLDAHVPGIHVPPAWIEALESANDADDAYRIGFDLSKRLYEDIMALHPKVHLMTANQFGIAKEILS